MEQLLYSDTKYNTLTDNQKELLLLFYSDMSDSEIAKKLGVSHSTVRHQKFTFREKAKQAKLYLAVFESVFEDKIKNEDAIIPIHNHAIYYDERYVITEKVVILTKIAEEFALGKKYKYHRCSEDMASMEIWVKPLQLEDIK